ncbi:MAG: hypothetical protein HQM08_00895 [Candidatus Riflebacteria bacterium]|nr:hypothetical protein [Candidatus Riflebacteria bacterium]
MLKGIPDSSTDLYCLLGWPVCHSINPIFWNTAFNVLNMNAVYFVFEVFPKKNSKAISGIASLGVRGFNLTLPFKEKIIPYLDKLPYPAEVIRVVNSVRIDENGQ